MVGILYINIIYMEVHINCTYLHRKLVYTSEREDRKLETWDSRYYGHRVLDDIPQQGRPHMTPVDTCI